MVFMRKTRRTTDRFSTKCSDCGGGRARARRRGIAMAISAVMVVGYGASPLAMGAAHADDSHDVTSRPDATTAVLTARLEKHRVEIADAETETTRTWANADGTFTTESAVAPVRVAQTDGSFAPVDLQLTQNNDGSYSPASSPTSVTIDDGRSKTSATLQEDSGRSVGLGWTSPLPEPTVSGGVATYELSSTENLVVAPTTTGFEEHIVLTAPPTDPLTLKVPLRLSKLDANETEGGGVELQTPSGATVANAPQFMMWDSSAGDDPDPSAETVVDSQLSSTAGTPELVLNPSMDYLTAPTTQYPVTIDPAMSLTSTESNYWFTNNTTDESGDYRMIVGTQDSGTTKYRSFVRFNLDSLMGKDVTNATMSMWQYDAGACTAKQIDALATTATGNGAVWGTQPATTTTGQANASFNTGDDTCSPTQPNGSESINVTTMIDDVASAALDWHGMELKADSETSNAYYKKFCSSVVVSSGLSTICDTASHVPMLSVTYNSYPAVAKNLSAAPTVIGTTGETYATSLTPTLSASAADADGGQDYVFYAILHDPNYSGEGTGTVWSQSKLGTAGSPEPVTVPSGVLIGGDHYEWEAIGYVYNANGTADFSSSWSPMRYFTTNVNPPTAATVTCTTFPSNTWTNAVPNGDSCTASDNPDNHVGGFYYAFDNPDPETAKATVNDGKTVTLNISNTLTNGWHTLYVQTYDRAYNRATTITQYKFGVGFGGVSSPSDGDTTQQAVTLTSTAAPAETGVTYNYRLGTTGTWVTVPTGDVTIPGTSTNPTWPQSITGGSSSALSWNVAQTVSNAAGSDGAVQLQACFSHSSTQDGCSTTETLTLAQGAFGDSQATTNFGPGTLSLLTGDLDVSVTDVDIPTGGDDLTLGRDLTTLVPPSKGTGATGVFGPGWSADLPAPGDGYAEETLTTKPGNHFATLIDSSGATLVYLTTNTSYPYTFTGIGDADDGSVLTQTSTTAASIQEIDGTVTSWTKVGSQWQVQTVNESGGLGTDSYSYNGSGQITQVVAPAPSGTSCSTSPLTTKGCRTLSLTYATASDPNLATGLSQSQWGDYWDATNSVGRLATVAFTAWDPSSSAMKTVNVAQYAYANNGMLRGEYDPRISPNLETTYSYVAGHRLSVVTPPGLNGDTIGYDSANRVVSVTWTDPANGTATATAAYGLPITGSSAPIDLSSAQTIGWGQSTDYPYTGTEIFPPDHVPATGSNGDFAPSSSDYPYGSITYLDVNGHDVNDATYGAGAWQIASTRYDTYGNVVWQLAPNGRQQALSPTSDTDPLVATMPTSALRADALSSTTVYGSNGYDPTDTFGPIHPITLDNGALAGQAVDGQDHTHYNYNQGAPSGGGPYDLVTETDQSPYFAQAGATIPLDYAPDTRVTLTGYNPIDGSSNTSSTSGWTLGEPTTSTIVMPGTGNNLAAQYEYDSNGNVLQMRTPKATSAGTDAHTTAVSYYTAGSSGSNPSCGNHPEWEGLVCTVTPAGQPTSGPSIPNTTTTYNIYDEPLTAVDSSGAVARTTTDTYDTSGRVQTSSISDTTTGVPNIPATTTNYDPNTGLPTGLSSSSGTVSVGYNAIGQVTSYTAPTSAGTNTSTTAYNIDGQVLSVDDGKGTTSYTYGGTDSLGRIERRGLVTAETTGVGSDTFTGSYDSDGNLISETYPNGIIATTGFDNIEQATSLTYVKGSTTWATFADTYNGFGEIVDQASPESGQTVSYDEDGRVSQVADAGDGTCTTRSYGYDADSNRSSFASYPADTTNSCSVVTAPTASESFSHDEADRTTNSGYTYDALGRTLSVPAIDTYDASATPTALNLSYYADDMVHTASQDGTTVTFTLDPAERILSQSSSLSGLTGTNVYGNGSDSPVWTANSDGTWSRNITDLSGGLAAVETANSTSAVTLQLPNLHGDTVATVADSASATGFSSYSEFTEFGVARGPASPHAYGWLGERQRSTEGVAGLVAMGVRAYLPTIGRFLQVDPEKGGSANAYDYVNQDPLDQIDVGGTTSSCLRATYTPCKRHVSNVERAFDFFNNHGFGPKAAAAITGNLIIESGVNPRKHELNGGPGRGIAQWTKGSDPGDRWQYENRYARHHPGGKWSLKLQLHYMLFELHGGNNSNNNESMAVREMAGHHSVRALARIFNTWYEGGTNVGGREDAAQAVYRKYG
jgi:RHS repeat-associated protein